MAILPMTALAQQNLTVSVTNPLKTNRSDQPVVISLAEYGDIRSAVVMNDGEEIPCQLDDLDQDETFDELCFLADLKGQERKMYQVTLFKEGEPREYKARVFTEMLVRNDKVKEKVINEVKETCECNAHTYFMYNPDGVGLGEIYNSMLSE